MSALSEFSLLSCLLSSLALVWSLVEVSDILRYVVHLSFFTVSIERCWALLRCVVRCVRERFLCVCASAGDDASISPIMMMVRQRIQNLENCGINSNGDEFG